MRPPQASFPGPHVPLEEFHMSQGTQRSCTCGLLPGGWHYIQPWWVAHNPISRRGTSQVPDSPTAAQSHHIRLKRHAASAWKHPWHQQKTWDPLSRGLVKLCQHPLLQWKRPRICETQTRRISKWHVTNRHGGSHTFTAQGKIPEGSLPCGWKSQLCALISSVSFHWCCSCCSAVCQRESSSGLAYFLLCWEGRCYLHSQSRRDWYLPAQSHRGTKLFPIPLEKKIHSVVWQFTQQHF